MLDGDFGNSGEFANFGVGVAQSDKLSNFLFAGGQGVAKSVRGLQELLVSRGVTPERQVIPYCAIGGRSADLWFALKYLLGYL